MPEEASAPGNTLKDRCHYAGRLPSVVDPGNTGRILHDSPIAPRPAGRWPKSCLELRLLPKIADLADGQGVGTHRKISSTEERPRTWYQVNYDDRGTFPGEDIVGQL